MWRDQCARPSGRTSGVTAAPRQELPKRRDVWRKDDKTSVTFVHLACSGATIRRGLIGGYAGAIPPKSDREWLPSQLSVLTELGGRAEVDAVVASVGANDTYFAPVARFCAFRTRCRERKFNPRKLLNLRPRTGQSAGAVVGAAVARVRDRYDELAAALPRSLESRRVHLVEYFDPTRDSRGRFCPRGIIRGFPRVGIDRDEIRWAYESILRPLNEEVLAATERNRWRLVDGIAERFRTHGYCAGRTRFVRTLWESLFKQGGSPASRMLGTLHPNGRGHEAIRDEI